MIMRGLVTLICQFSTALGPLAWEINRYYKLFLGRNRVLL